MATTKKAKRRNAAEEGMGEEPVYESLVGMEGFKKLKIEVP
jgi:hypothetical protein